MIKSYKAVSFATGLYNAGIYRVQLAPREWLQDDITRDFNTGKVIDEAILVDNNKFIELKLTPESYHFDEKPKTGRAGSYFETEISGLTNDISDETLLSLETLRNHEMVAIIYTKKMQRKIIGTKKKALRLTFSNTEDNTNGGQQICTISLTMENECLSPFYEV